MLSVDGADNKVINRVGNPDVLEVNGQKSTCCHKHLTRQTVCCPYRITKLSAPSVRICNTAITVLRKQKDNGELNSSLVFYQGLMTPVEAMPQTGSAIYQGNAFYNDVSNINTVGSSLFNVDFGEKSLTGGVYSAEGRFNPVMLQANIAGNRFVYVDGTTKTVCRHFPGSAGGRNGRPLRPSERRQERYVRRRHAERLILPYHQLKRSSENLEIRFSDDLFRSRPRSSP